MAINIQFRRGTASEWTAANPTLAVAEMGIETDTDKFKLGNGSTAWTSLGYGGIKGDDGTSGVVTATSPLTYNAGTSTVGIDNTVVINPMTTAQDLIVADGASSVTRLGVGTDDQVLSVVAGEVAWADAAGGGGMNSIVEIIATDSAYDVSAISGFVRFTLVGGGGGGSNRNNPSGGAGGTTSIVSGGVTTSASGGLGGIGSTIGRAAQNAFVSYNSGQPSASQYGEGFAGLGGEIKTVYYNLSDVSTIDVTVGAAGPGGGSGKDGFRGVIVMEYSA